MSVGTFAFVVAAFALLVTAAALVVEPEQSVTSLEAGLGPKVITQPL